MILLENTSKIQDEDDLGVEITRNGARYDWKEKDKNEKNAKKTFFLFIKKKKRWKVSDNISTLEERTALKTKTECTTVEVGLNWNERIVKLETSPTGHTGNVKRPRRCASSVLTQDHSIWHEKVFQIMS